MLWQKEWRLLPQRLALHEPSGTAVLADVHLGYCAARQRQGDAIPGRSVAEEIQPLFDAAAQRDIRSIVIAGDLFEAGYDAHLMEQFLDLLDRRRIAFLGLVPGNHDRGVEVGGRVFADGYDLAGWHIVHGDHPVGTSSLACPWNNREPAGAAGTSEAGDRLIAGHWHPAVRWQRRKVPSFLSSGQRLILPAFSLDAAGVDIGADSRWRTWRCHAIVGNRVMEITDPLAGAWWASRRSPHPTCSALHSAPVLEGPGEQRPVGGTKETSRAKKSAARSTLARS
jgi:metallophosphoesterase superfamily enzyme